LPLDFSQPEAASADKPVISVVVAARNEESVISECLNALANQRISVPFEVVVVDNNSTDLTFVLARKFPCKIVRESKPDQLAAKRSGVEAARGRIIVILDADCVPGETWLSSIYSAMTNTKHSPVAVTCCYKYVGLPWWAKIFIVSSRVLLVCIPRTLLGTVPFVIGGNVAFRQDALARGGGYPEDGGIAETELGLANRLRKTGRIFYLPAMAVPSSARRFHKGPASFFIDYKWKQYILPYLRRTS
jgi:glycosyltransferase involved in cell wall biosynthesis